MMFSSGGAKPKIHSSAYVAPSAVLSGEVVVGPDCAILHGAVLTAEGAPLEIGARSVIMENAVVKSSGGKALQFPTRIGKDCIVGPGAYVVGARVDDGCFIASGARVFNGAHMESGSSVELRAILHVNARLARGASVPMQHIAAGNPAAIFPPEKAAEVAQRLDFFENVFNIEAGSDARAKAAAAYSKFLRAFHASDARTDTERSTKPVARRAGEEPPRQQVADVGGVVNAMMLELQEMEHRRKEATKKRPPS